MNDYRQRCSYTDSEIMFDAYFGNEADKRGLITTLESTFNLMSSQACQIVNNRQRIHCTASQFGVFIAERTRHVAINQVRHLNTKIIHNVDHTTQAVVDLRPGRG